MGKRLLSLAFGVAAAVLAITVMITGALQPVENAFFDARLAARDAAPWPDDMVAVVVDGRAQAAHGLWRWDRSQQAALYQRLQDLGARTVVLNMLPALPGNSERADADLEAALEGVLLPVDCAGGNGRRDGWEASVRPIQVHPWARYRARDLLGPLPRFARAARGIGHACGVRKQDGVMRAHQPFVQVGDDQALPSLALVAWLEQRGHRLEDATVTGSWLELPEGRRVRLYGGAYYLDLGYVDGPNDPHRLREISAADVLDPGHAEAMRRALTGKLVVVEVSEKGANLVPSPFSRTRIRTGTALAGAIRTLDTGDEPRHLGVHWVLLVLLLLTPILGPLVMRRRAVVIVTGLVAAMAGYVAVALGLSWAFDLYLPLVPPLVFILSCGGGFALPQLSQLESRIERAPASGDADEAPDGRVALVFTDVQGSTELWDRFGPAMPAALALHDRILREHMVKGVHYEVKTEGDAFMVAAASVQDAVKWCLAVQQALLEADWPAALTADGPARRERTSRGVVLHQGLRVRMGVHVGTPDARPNPLVYRMDYYGPVVNRAARVASAAHGGQILLSGAAWDAVRTELYQLGFPESQELGTFQLKGLQEPERLVEITPRSLAGRAFPAPQARTAAGGDACAPRLSVRPQPDGAQHWEAPSLPGQEPETEADPKSRESIRIPLGVE